MASSHVRWPPLWQPEAIDAVTPYLGSGERLRIVVDPPETAIWGTALEGHVYVDDGMPMIVHDRSGRSDVHPWRLLSGPVLRVELLRPRRRPVVLYAHPDWTPGRR